METQMKPLQWLVRRTNTLSFGVVTMNKPPAFFFFNRWLHRISRILAVLGYEGIKQATPVVLHPKRKSSAHSL